ncbi:MAG: MoaD/ThiS family protein [Syntrophorhabdales bacterium]|jgi:molybdopterin converting factor small subunit
MTVEIRLFATFRAFLPPGSNTFSCTKVLKEGTTVEEVLRALKLPEHTPKIIILNGAHADAGRVLRDGDILSLFPPVGGG